MGLRNGVEMKNLKLTSRIFPFIFFIFLFSINIFPQVEIKERIEINPGVKMDYQMTLDSIYFNGCWYDFYDSSEIYIRFTPESVEPGGTTLMKLWIVDGVYEYNEDLKNFLQKTITIEPECGELNYIGGGEYLFTAPDTLTVDSIVVNIDYENYTHSCTNKPGIKEKTRIKDRYDCLSCMPLRRTLHRTYASGQLTIAWDSLDVKVEPDTIYPGDTAQVVIKKRLPDGTLIDFDSTQTYVAGMLDGCILGKLVAGVQEGPYVVDVLQPIYFIADTSVDTIGSVLLRVGLVESTNKSTNKNNEQTDFVGSDCFIGGQFGSYEDVTVVKEHPIEIIFPTSNSPDEWITSAPEMPEVSYAVILHNHLGQPVKLICEYEISYTYQRKWLSGSSICNRISKIIYYDTLDAYGGVVYVNPVVFTEDKATFEFKARGHRGSGCNEIITTWDEGNEVFTGGNVIIRVTATDLSWDAFAFKEQAANRILGSNPDPSEIIFYTNDNVIRAIIEFEAKEYQFEYNANKSWPYNQEGWPLYGEPNGYGLMQLDNTPVATEKQLWNWKANIDGGKTKFYSVKEDTDEFLNNHELNVTVEMRLKCAYQKYNFHGSKLKKKERYFYKWDGINWIENDLIPVDTRVINGEQKKYGDWVYEKYSEFN